MSDPKDVGKKPSKKTMTAIDLVSENNQLRKESYLDRRETSIRLLAILGVSFIANVFLLWLTFFHFPIAQFGWTSNAGAVCKATPVNEPHIGQEIVADFALQASVGIYNYDYVNYLRQITGVADRHFTPSFRDKFIPMFGGSANIKAVVDNFYVVSATENPKKPPQISRVGLRDGAYFWDVQIPLNIYYSSGRKVQMEKILATVTVVRVDPSRMNPRGIAVDNIITSPMTE